MARGMAAYINEYNDTENLVYVASNGSVVHQTLVRGSGKPWTPETVAKDNNQHSDVAAFAWQLQHT
jgi:hypothetical protein